MAMPAVPDRNGRPKLSEMIDADVTVEPVLGAQGVA